MKYRKDAGASKLPEDVKKSTLDNFIEEVVDIHRDVFDDAKKLFDSKFGDVHTIEDLKSKIESVIASFTTEVEAQIESIKTQWEEKKTEVQKIIERAYNEKITLLEEAKKKGLAFAGSALDTVEPWIADARKALDAAYKKAQSHKNP